jgi:arginyl-tRNA synthetase
VSSLPSLLSARVEAVTGVDPELRPATKPQFGHFQSNVALRLANAEGRRPRDVATEIVAKLEIADLCEPPEIAGPGFINFRLRTDVLASAVTDQLADPSVGLLPADHSETVVIDYSAPNVAKQMHVGNLRSTIIGDCLHRVLAAVGHRVIPQNHIGDWGTQFGMLVEQIMRDGTDVLSLDLAGAEAVYQRANARFKADAEFANAARRRVVALQSGDPETRLVWRQLLEISKTAFNAAYARLGVLLTDADLAGESIYNDDLAAVVAELEESGVAVIDDGALCVFIEGFNAPMIVRKADGGYGYSTTDLAAIRHRVRNLHADRIIYVVGAPQSYHFDQVFAVSRLAGFLPDGVRAEHVAFGQVLGADGKKFSTREGTAVTLNTLLDAAEEQAAPPIAMAAVKYADLSTGLNKDYVFDVSRMVQTTGNTGPYLQYAHARMSQVLRKADAEGCGEQTKVLVLDEPAEQALALLLTRYGETVDEVADTLQPHRLCAYLYDLAGALSIFYEQCPVLKSTGDVRDSRLALCSATKRVLASGLNLLGIEALERM